MHRRLRGVGYLLGFAGFILFFISDANDWKLSCRALKLCFPVGFVLLAAGTARALSPARALLRGPARWAVLILAALFLALEIYTLFFALSAKEAYTCQGQERPVCKSGVYALCRHPGVLWFMGLCLCLWAAAGLALQAAVFFSALDVLLVLFEDRCVFPARLDGYDDYRAETPFLLPNRQSIRACCGRGEQRGA